MITADALSALGALAHPTRLATFRLLVAHAPDGLSTGALVAATALSQSTLSTHLAVLVNARLVVTEKRGRQMIQHAQVAVLRDLMLFLVKDCCQGRPDLCAPLLDDLAAELAAEPEPV
ncbi:metalloregulator ArsR/SmtB family transcription factor [Sphingomonas sp. RB3P16]|uniref:ArsR/SmtB family transcription factor n=1 Tax=Parasphingomonas frigoris TaxID=3096163 RepID=UPI002FCB7FC6